MEMLSAVGASSCGLCLVALTRKVTTSRERFYHVK
jgi:hypothetical protein